MPSRRRAGRSVCNRSPNIKTDIFFNKIEVQCIRCHRIGGEGSSEVAPDLTGIGERRDREYILESIVAPNAQSAEGFETSLIVLKDGTQYSGIVREDNEFSLKLEVTIEAEDEEARAAAKREEETRQKRLRLEARLAVFRRLDAADARPRQERTLPQGAPPAARDQHPRPSAQPPVPKQGCSRRSPHH